MGVKGGRGGQSEVKEKSMSQSPSGVTAMKPGEDSRSSHLKVMATLARTAWMVKAKLQGVEEREVWEGD